MKRITLLSIILFTVIAINAQDRIKHGITLNGGLGNIQQKFDASLSSKLADKQLDYKAGLSLGYKLRFNQSSTPLFFDVDGTLGARAWKDKDIFSKPDSEIVYIGGAESNDLHYYMSLGGSVNYRIYKGLSIGVGITPEWVFNKSENSKNNFDTPLIGKIAYDFGKIEVGFTYKHGMTNLLKTEGLKTAKIREFQLSVFVPLGRK